MVVSLNVGATIELIAALWNRMLQNLYIDLSPECESPRGFLHWGAEMRIESTSAGLSEVWSTWDEDRSMGRVTARCFVFDDAMDRIVWAMDRAGDSVTADVAVGVGLPIF
ncbi:hypothetical protein [Burkholderia pyrrocinia]